MIKLHNFLNVIGYEVHGKDFIPNTPYGDMVAEVEHGTDSYWLTCTFDVVSQEVFEIIAEDYINNNYYRWIHEDFRKEVSDTVHWAGKASYTELEVVEDMLEKADAIVSGISYDTRVTVPLDITDEEFLEYAKMAHKMDITFNQFCEQAIRNAIEKHMLNKEF